MNLGVTPLLLSFSSIIKARALLAFAQFNPLPFSLYFVVVVLSFYCYFSWTQCLLSITYIWWYSLAESTIEIPFTWLVVIFSYSFVVRSLYIHDLGVFWRSSSLICCDALMVIARWLWSDLLWNINNKYTTVRTHIHNTLEEGEITCFYDENHFQSYTTLYIYFQFYVIVVFTRPTILPFCPTIVVRHTHIIYTQRQIQMQFTFNYIHLDKVE